MTQEQKQQKLLLVVLRGLKAMGLSPRNKDLRNLLTLPPALKDKDKVKCWLALDDMVKEGWVKKGDEVHPRYSITDSGEAKLQKELEEDFKVQTSGVEA